MTDVQKELARTGIDFIIAVAVCALMIAALAAEVYYLWWPTASNCIQGILYGPVCGATKLSIEAAVLAIGTVWAIHAGGTWLQKCLRRRLPALDWYEPEASA